MLKLVTFCNRRLVSAISLSLSPRMATSDGTGLDHAMRGRELNRICKLLQIVIPRSATIGGFVHKISSELINPSTAQASHSAGKVPMM